LISRGFFLKEIAMEMRPIGNIAQNAQRVADKAPVVNEQAFVSAKPAAAPLDTINAVQQSAAIPNLNQVAEAVQNINKTMKELSQNLEFSIDTDSKQTVVKVVDQQTHEVIRQMPSAEALEIAKALDRVQGLLIRQKA
jgi:flagellar protein FlaG